MRNKFHLPFSCNNHVVQLTVVMFVAIMISTGELIAAENTFCILPSTSVVEFQVPIGVAEEIYNDQRWQALVCKGTNCKMRPVSISPTALQRNGRIRTEFSMPSTTHKNGQEEYVIALIFGLANKGNIHTYFAKHTPRTAPDDANGTLGVFINTPSKNVYRILPRWNAHTKDKWLTVYLEQNQRRQMLGRINLQSLQANFEIHDFVLWAGDIDGDNKLDLITYLLDRSNTMSLQLNLSSLAKGEELTGLAAQLSDWQEIEMGD